MLPTLGREGSPWSLPKMARNCDCYEIPLPTSVHLKKSRRREKARRRQHENMTFQMTKDQRDHRPVIIRALWRFLMHCCLVPNLWHLFESFLRFAALVHLDLSMDMPFATPPLCQLKLIVSMLSQHLHMLVIPHLPTNHNARFVHNTHGTMNITCKQHQSNTLLKVLLVLLPLLHLVIGGRV